MAELLVSAVWGEKTVWICQHCGREGTEHGCVHCACKILLGVHERWEIRVMLWTPTAEMAATELGARVGDWADIDDR